LFVKPHKDETFIYSCVWQKIDNFSLPRSLLPKLVVSAFGQGKFVRVSVAKENLTKCTRNISMVLANKRQP
jgi:hypothetical protein